MSDRHLNYRVEVALNICTNKSQQQLLNCLKCDIEAIVANWYITCGEITIKNVQLCDCDFLEDADD